MSALIILIIVCALTYTFEIVFGLAGTILMIPLLSFLFPVKTLVVYSVLPQILVAVIGLVRSPKKIDRNFMTGMLLFAFMGAVVGFTLFYNVSSGTFQILLAAAITAAGLFLVIAPHRARFNPAGLRVMDTLAGTSQALFGISGPIAMTRLLATFPDKNTVRHNAFAFFLSMNILRASEYAVHGTYTNEILWMILVSGPFLAVTLWFSNQLHLHINERVFRKVVAWMILIGGLSLFYR
ncbi:MAG: sulfite exporter TauE/SafE family protein [Gammaproteobacteria bacterium]|nr:sulfite exporter TauE/SafE family protein [Gammaproteobacteria bacterium]MDH3405656.1 sulfite exporter TauE/SafE family protein [Gammaproteobacteria bacterium]MDH3563516.1 sulfite exporter TauE/SafE family protein [Gammaproteobacteria bacterium]MDH5486764.1 sulfite exporter TauE/SafE family protein [Gammaproteobacteria bacterium]